MRADLHLHTTASDGLLTPARMVREARLAGMNIIAITDHDTVSGVREALDAGVREGVRVLPGLELSVGGEEEIHLLAYACARSIPGCSRCWKGCLCAGRHAWRKCCAGWRHWACPYRARKRARRIRRLWGE